MSKANPLKARDRKIVFGKNVLIEQDVELGTGNVIGNNVIIHGRTRIGKNVTISDNAVVGKPTSPGPTSSLVDPPDRSDLIISDNCLIGAGAVVFAGSKIGTATMIGDLAVVREGCLIDDFVLVGCRVVIENDVRIGAYTKIQTGAYITAYVTLEDHVFIAPMVTTTNDNTMGRGADRATKKRGALVKRGARVGGGSVLLPGVVVGREAFIAAGSVVTRDVPDGQLVKGVPARFVRQVPESEWLKQ